MGRSKKKLFLIHSLQTKIFIMNIAIALVVTITSLCISYYAEINTIKNTTETYLTQYLYFADNSFRVMLNEAKQVSITIAADRKMISEALIRIGENASYENYLRKKEIERFLSSLTNQGQYINNIILISWDKEIYQAGEYFIAQRDIDKSIYKKAMQLTRMELLYDGEKEVLLCCPIEMDNERKIVSIVKLRYDSLMQPYQWEPLDSMQIYVFSSDNTLFYTNMKENGNESQLLEGLHNLGANYGYTDWNGEKNYYVALDSGGYGLKTVALIPNGVLLEDAVKLKHKFLLIGVFAVIITSIGSICFSKKLCINIKKLTKSIHKVQNGDLTVTADVVSNDEVGKLSETFNDMMERIRYLMKENAIKEKMKIEAQQSVLETQIEPHFLYNTIDSIRYVAHMRNVQEIETVAVALSELCRSVLSNSDEFITLWEEKEYVENYITIERFKYQQAFQVNWDVDEALWSYKIPKLLLQPIVENALIHGIADMGDDGRIQIKIYESMDHVMVQIIDNGKGMEEDQIKRLMEQIKTNDKSGFRRVGIANVFNRIKLIYGEEYSGTIFSCRNEFTCVELKLPKNEVEI